MFLPDWYLKRYPEVALAQIDPYQHYLKQGEKQGYKPNPFFERKWYISHSGVKKYTGLALIHYALHGWKKGHSPAPGFCAPLYLQSYPDVKTSGTEPLRHFLHYGRYNDYLAFDISLKPKGKQHIVEAMLELTQKKIFDGTWYRSHYSDIIQNNLKPLNHFIMHGREDRRNPNSVFDTAFYQQHHWREIGPQEIPVLHYIHKGYKLGYDAGPDFPNDEYMRAFQDVDWDKTDPLSHFLSEVRPKGYSSPLEFLDKEFQETETDDDNASTVDIPIDPALRMLTRFREIALSPEKNEFSQHSLDLHWVMPDFSEGSGGHMTIFRMINRLELKGHKQTVWINNPVTHRTPNHAFETINKYFQHFTGTVRFIDSDFSDISGDAIIATDCWSVYPVMSASNFIRRFYFVQDFEPSFHAMGAQYLAAEQTYRKGLDCICAGPWLSKLMIEKYGLWARHFDLAADQSLYHPSQGKRQNDTPRIAVYARHFTARRAVEFAFLALEELARKGIKFTVDFFGAPLPFNRAPFDFTDHGVASPDALARLFQKADVGLVFSATNYSLVPQEMMACGLPIIELKGENTLCIFPDDTVTLAEPNPLEIAEALAELLKNDDRRTLQREAGAKWVSDFSWDKSADMVEAALLDRLGEFAERSKQDAPTHQASPKASIVIPTLNAGPNFKSILESVTNQKTPWPYEVLVIDSGSTDETIELVSQFPMVKLHQIPQQEFSHGGTRNLGVELTGGEYIAFLTHDALPANDRWLYHLVSALAHQPTAAGVFGSHLPWPDASEYTKRDLSGHFENLKEHPLLLSRDTDKKRYDQEIPGWRQVLHFYSDNNSCMRRSVWEKIPYRKIAYGEDQVWADDIIKAGYGKLYAPQAIVFHSHDYDEAETFERSKTEAAFFKHFFGYELMKDKAQLKKSLEGLNERDRDYGDKAGLSEEEINRQCGLNQAHLKGYLAGGTISTETLFSENDS